MNHQSAIESRAAERYVLGKMNHTERDAYEEHFFSCAVCAREVKLADAFLRAVRRSIRQSATVRVPSRRAPGVLRSLLRRLWLFWLSRETHR